MSIHVCKCKYKGEVEYHLRYPGLTEKEAQDIADLINSGALLCAKQRADAQHDDQPPGHQSYHKRDTI